MEFKDKRIGTFYLSARHFQDEANQTVGKPGVGPNMMEIFQNRRSVTGRLTDLGKQAKKNVVEYFKKTYGVKVKLWWSQKAGCTMCPCSPGFMIMAEIEVGSGIYFPRSSHHNRDNKVTIHMKDGTEVFDIREPKWGFALDKLKTAEVSA